MHCGTGMKLVIPHSTRQIGAFIFRVHQAILVGVLLNSIENSCCIIHLNKDIIMFLFELRTLFSQFFIPLKNSPHEIRIGSPPSPFRIRNCDSKVVPPGVRSKGGTVRNRNFRAPALWRSSWYWNKRGMAVAGVAPLATSLIPIQVTTS